MTLFHLEFPAELFRLNLFGYSRRRVRKTLTVSGVNRKNRVKWCRGKLTWSVEQNWKKVIFSDETQVVWVITEGFMYGEKPMDFTDPNVLDSGGSQQLVLCFGAAFHMVELEHLWTLQELWTQTGIYKHLMTIYGPFLPNISQIMTSFFKMTMPHATTLTEQ